jgi:toluene monooxygenase system protein D
MGTSGDGVNNNNVGPIFRPGELADAAIEAIREDNPGKVVHVDDRGAYIRVSVDGECILRRETVGHFLGRPCRMQEVEIVLGSFAGQIETTEDYMRFYLATRL